MVPLKASVPVLVLVPPVAISRPVPLPSAMLFSVCVPASSTVVPAAMLKVPPLLSPPAVNAKRARIDVDRAGLLKPMLIVVVPAPLLV